MGKKTQSKRMHVGFIGGPLDGLHDDVEFRKSEVLAFPIDSDLVASLSTDRPVPDAPATSVAFYRLRLSQPDEGRYLFLGATAPDLE